MKPETPSLTEREALIVGLVFGVLVAAALAIDLLLMLAAMLRGNSARGPLFSPRWSLVDVWLGGQLALLGTLLAAVCLAFVDGVARGAAGHAQAAPPGELSVPVLLASLVPQSAMLIGIPAVYVLARYGESLESVGLVPVVTKAWRSLLWRVPLLFAAGAASAWAVQAGMRALLGPALYERLDQLSRQLGNQKVLEDALATPGTAVFTLVLAGLVVPFAEEVFFRGFLYGAARRRLGVRWAVVLSSVVFAVVHAGPLLVLAIVPIGVLLALAYERTRSLWVPVVMHAAFNSVQLVAAIAGWAEV